MEPPMEGYSCDVSQLLCGICPGVSFGLPWTHAEARAQTLNEPATPRLLRPEKLVFIQDQGYTPCPGSYAARVAIA